MKNTRTLQDFGYNLDELKEGLEFVDKETKIYPLWLCPTRHCIPQGMEHLSLFKREDVHVDVRGENLRAFGGESLRASPTDALRCRRDERALSLEPH